MTATAGNLHSRVEVPRGDMTATAGRGWAYVGALLGAGVSVAANVAHSYVPPAGARPQWTPHAGAVVGAVFWPVALLAALEVMARVPWPDGSRWVWVRFGGLVPVALVAAIVSYRHLSGLLAYYGEDRITSMVGPLAVDGLMVMATGALLATRPVNTDTVPDSVSPSVAALGTGARVAALRAEHPDMHPAAIAARLGVSVRTVRRHLSARPAAVSS